MTVSLLLALMAPTLNAQGTLAPAEPSDTSTAINGEEPSPSGTTELPVENPDDVPPVEGEESLEPEPSIPVDEPTVGRALIEFTVYGCPVGTDATDPPGLPTACGELVNGVQINLDPPDIDGQTGPPYENGVVRFSELTAGAYEATMILPAGYASAYAPECEPAPQEPLETTRITEAFQLSLDLADDQYLTCAWYLFPEGNASADPFPSGPGLAIVKWTCPEGYDWQDPQADPTQDCDEGTNNVQFNVEGPDNYTSQSSTGDSVDGAVVFGGIPPGDYDVTETLPDGIGSAFVSDCVSYEPGGTNTSDSYADLTDEGDGPTLQVSLSAGSADLIYCNWYDVPGGNTITITKWLCPAGYDYLSDESDREADCNQTLDGIDFLLEQTAPTTGEQTATTGDDDPGVATFEDLEPGMYELSEVPSDDYPEGADGFRYCTDFGFGQPGVEAAPVGEAFEFEIEEDQTFEGVCDWYDIPGGGTESPSESASASPSLTGNSITIYKWLCPAGYDYLDDESDPETDCATPVEGIDFLLAQTDPSTGEETATTDAGGLATFSDLVPGTFALSEVPSTDYPVDSAGFRYCTDFGFGQPGFEAIAVGEPFSFEVEQGEFFEGYCDWYNVPGGASPSSDPSATTQATDNVITIYKWLCPTGYDWLAEDADPTLDCTEAHDDISFLLIGPGGTTSNATTGADDPGVATFEDLELGDYSLQEVDDSGTYNYVVRCYFLGEEPSPYSSVLPGEVYDLVAPDDAESWSWVCDWYNIPSGNSVTIYKWLCPANYDYLSDESDPELDCATPIEGIDFLLAQTDPMTGEQTATTDAGGLATFTGLDPGSYDLSEVPSTDYPVDSAGFRYCTDFGFGQPGFEAIAVGEPFSFEIEEGAIFEGYCDWYNVPGGNTVTISKWECPAYYDYTMTGVNPTVDCNIPVDDIPFTIYAASEDAGTTDTTVAGTVMFDTLGFGDYEIEETYPADGRYDSSFVRCYFEGTDGAPAYGTYLPGDRYPLSIPEGDGSYVNWYCDWFNVPGGSTITIYKWLCPYDYDWQATGADPMVDCAEWVDGIDFRLAQTAPSPGEVTVTTGTTQPGIATYDDLPPGTYELSEVASPYQPGGFFRCYILGTEPGPYSEIEVAETYTFGVGAGERFEGVCHWFNIPWDNDITIVKWDCPYGYDWEAAGADPYADCTERSNGVWFNATNEGSSLSGATGNDGPGQVTFSGLGSGTWEIEETPPDGYAGVLVGTCYLDGTDPNGTYEVYSGDTRWWTSVDLPEDGSSRWTCHFFNILTDDPGQVIIYKWTCPDGYDITAWGANAEADCTEATNGVQFNASGPDGYTSQTDTGDAIDGAVMFGGIEPGDYTFTETLPPDTWYVFISDCVGTSVDAVHPYPLWIGNPLDVRVNPGDEIVCNWYNVPYYDDGTIVVTKYICSTSTSTYTSPVNCEIYEGGATFNLYWTETSPMSKVADGTTGANGLLTWYGLDPGHYTLTEQGYTPCYITASQVDDGYVYVTEGTTTYVSVYNCASKPKPSASDPGKPRPSNSPPGKYPNTGTDPNATGETPLPIYGAEESPSPRIVSTGDDSDPEASDGSGEGDGNGNGDGSGPGDGNGTGPNGASASAAAAVACASVTPANASAEPSESPSGSASPSPSPDQVAVTAASLAPSPDPSDAVDCARGAVPASIAIEAADVDASIEQLETIDGEMQAPTGAEDASWYLETSRLGEEGPIVIAGHLNYWNTPEGVFYAIAELQVGDIIEVTGDDGGIYAYEIRTVDQAPSDSSPSTIFDGLRDDLGGETLVLITCGGEWDTSISEYNQRTVVIAVRVPADEEGSGY